MVTALFKWFVFACLLMNSRVDQKLLDSGHPFYVTVTEINHNAKEANLEISCKMFADDFENTLKSANQIPIDIVHPKDRKQLENMIAAYLQKHLQFKVNGKPVTTQFVGFEKENESVWCYLEVNQVPEVKKLDIMNDLLYESHDSQISIMHVIVAGNRKSTKLVYPDKNTSLEF